MNQSIFFSSWNVCLSTIGYKITCDAIKYKRTSSRRENLGRGISRIWTENTIETRFDERCQNYSACISWNGGRSTISFRSWGWLAMKFKWPFSRFPCPRDKTGKVVKKKKKKVIHRNFERMFNFTRRACRERNIALSLSPRIMKQRLVRNWRVNFVD